MGITQKLTVIANADPYRRVPGNCAVICERKNQGIKQRENIMRISINVLLKALKFLIHLFQKF